MPILLDDLDLSSAKPANKTVDAKFFSSRLTGYGKKVGLLNESLRPVNTVTNTAYAQAMNIEIKQSSTQHDVTTVQIPLAPVIRRAMLTNPQATVAVPHVDERFALDTAVGGVDEWNVVFDMTPQALTLYEDKSGDSTRRDLVIQYRMELFFLRKSLPEPERAAGGNIDADVVLTWDTSPAENARAFIEDALRIARLRASNLDELDAWMDEYPIHTRIARLAEVWASDGVADEVCQFVGDLPASPTQEQLNMLALQLRYLENYNVPLEAYRQIHKKLDQLFPNAVSTKLSKQNLNLLMNHTLDDLDQKKAQLVTPAQPTGALGLRPELSAQQLAAVTTHEPLVMTQAGAGTGKSSVILERIKYLEGCGVPAGDITVLSFTNAAADNITEKNPNVGSMTIARMIIDIYELSHPTHKLADIDTIVNSIDIFYPSSQFAADFRHRLLELKKESTGAATSLNTFVENHYDEVIELLDRIRQTSLELQIIICYQKIDVMPEPAHVQSRYLIIDEVQDNSIFEFIYLLKYVAKHKQSMFIVGDASQTLFEFRSANPRALNTLESSGVFATYKLTTNYRSNQEILDFANVALGGLETNQFANIQLQANSLAMPTADTFQEKVTLAYHEVPKLSAFTNGDLAPLLRNVVIPEYVQPALDRGEQVAFLAYSRKEVALVQEVLEARFPDRHVASLVSEQVYSTDIFSKYIKNFWNDVLQTPPNNAAFVVTQGMRDNLDKLTRNASNPKVERAILSMISEWWVTNSVVITGWVKLNAQGSLGHRDFFDRLRDNLLTFEVERHQRKVNVTKQKNQERKRKNLESKVDLVVSTIHGAKGLEFDNVVVLHKEDTKMNEADKRMYYVAFTRAMLSEYVLSYGTVRNAPIESSYEQIVNALTKRDEKNALRAQGIDPDLVDDDAAPTGDQQPVPEAV